MRIARLLSMLLVVLVAGLSAAPAATAEPPFRLQTHVTDQAGVLSSGDQDEISSALDKLYQDKRIQLWVVYVQSFDGQNWMSWAQQTMKLSGFGDGDALLAIATKDREFAFQVPSTATGGSSTLADDVRRNAITPALRNNDWTGAAVAAANGLNAGGGACRGWRF